MCAEGLPDGAPADRASTPDDVPSSSFTVFFGDDREGLEIPILSEWAASVIRLALVAFAAVTYLLVREPGIPSVWTAYGVLVLAGLYSGYLLWKEPYRRYDFLVSSTFVSVVDVTLVLAWIYLTGAYDSVYYPLLYASVVGFSLRYGPWETLWGATLHAAGYVALLAGTGELLANLAPTAVRVGFIYLLGGLGVLLSVVTYRQTVAKETYKNLAEELEQAVSLHEATLDSTEDGIIALDLEGRIVTYNERFRELWGIPESILASGNQETALEHVEDLLEDPGQVRRDMAKVEANPEAVTYDEIHLTDGRVFERFSQPQRIGDEIVGRVVSFRDVTAERETKRKLQQRVSLHRATLDSTADGILVVDLDGSIVSYNDRFQEMWDLPDEIVASRDDEAAIAYVTDQLVDPDAFQKRIQQLYENIEEESLDEIELENGRIFERYSQPQRLGGEIVGRVWSFRDVTEERRAKRALQRSNEDLERFAYYVSHDLREPLRMISGYLDLIERRAGDSFDDEIREFFDYATRGAERLGNMIRALLEYSRIGRPEELEGPVDLEDVVEDALANLQARIEEEDATVHVGPLPVVRGDRDQLTMLFQNLFSNAIRYSGDDPPRIQVEAHRDDGAWQVDVQDHGVGIPEEEQERIFEMFTRGSASSWGSGDGVGLALCQRIVDRHGGTIQVDSTPGEGSVFSFTLPPTEPDEPSGQDPSQMTPKTGMGKEGA